MALPDLRTRPEPSEFASFYAGYVGLVPDADILSALRDGGRDMVSLLAALPEAKGGFRYAEGKWTIRELVGHVIDAERIFTYRALRIARGDQTPLPGFQEKSYAVEARSDERTLAGLVKELETVRASTVMLFESFPSDAWSRRGIASDAPVSVRALAFITAGHAMHHVRVLREKYLVGV